MLMGSLFVSDGDIMIAMSAMSHVERAGGLLIVGAGDREDGLDISAYPLEMGVHTILSECATRANGGEELDFAAM